MQYHFCVLFLSLWVSPGTAMSETMTFRMTNPGRLAISVALLGVGCYLGFSMEHKSVL